VRFHKDIPQLEGLPMKEALQRSPLLIAVILPLFSGCATTPNSSSVTDTTERIKRYGYSILYIAENFQDNRIISCYVDNKKERERGA
jgi:hypothetical protein